jgi:DNA invertase Pin-like site-specific DNA recombinase
MNTDSGILSMPRRAYSYCRISDPSQAKGDGLQRQADFAQQLCHEHGWCLDDSLILIDKGVSAFHGANAATGALSRFLEAVQVGRITPGSVLIVENIDRLSREQVDEAYDLFRRILKAGVWIATREPRRIYRREEAGNMLNLLEPLFIMARGHEESKLKSLRIGDAWERNRRRARASKQPITERCPAWIELTQDGFRLIPQHAETLRTIYQLALEGLGSTRIVLWLNEHTEEHPPFAGNSAWNKSYVTHLLRTRQVLGEYQPRKGSCGRRMVPDGDPIPGYYPAVVTEEQWQLLQAARAGRKHHTGRPGLREANLFTGIVYEARSRRPMGVRATAREGRNGLRRYAYLAATETGWGGVYGFRYELFEQAMRKALTELRPRDILPASAELDRREARITELTGRLVALSHQADLLEEQIATPENADVLPALVAGLRRNKSDAAQVAKELQALKLESTTGRGESLGQAQSIDQLLTAAQGKPEELVLRRRLKAAIRQVVEEIWILSQPITRRKQVLHVQIYLHGGQRKYVPILPKNAPPGVAASAWNLGHADFRAGDIGRIAGDTQPGAQLVG